MTPEGYGICALLVAVAAAVGVVKFFRGEGFRYLYFVVYFCGPIFFAFVRKWRGL